MHGVLRQLLTQALAFVALSVPSPVFAGDWADPTVIATDGDYVALTTSNHWAPSFRVLRSPDLEQWRITGAVFRRPPRWVRGTFWAPEITRLGSGYAVFYSALPKTSEKAYCLGVATAPEPEGPWKDLGRPLHCSRYGSIDPFPVRDEQGRLNLLWKSNANRFKRRTPIYAQRMSEDARRLLGRPRELIRNDAPWERKVVEAPAVVRRDDGFFYLFYSGALCCTPPCDYAEGVARSRSLLGPWRKFDGNPILRSGNGWRCPGHASFVDNEQGDLTAVFHAYRAGSFLAGRQLLTAPVTFGADGWPEIGDGRPPPPAPGAASTAFSDGFDGPLATEWEWPLSRLPGRATQGGVLTLSAPGLRRKGERAPDRLDGAVLARRVGTVNYTATAVIDRGSLTGETAGGLSSFKDGSEFIAVTADRRRVTVLSRNRDKDRVLARTATPASDKVHLRMVARARRFFFDVSPDGVRWKRVGRTFKTPVTETARLALLAGGERRARVRFESAELAE